jgi:hypothetical protein
MATITLRSTKGSPLTNTEVDNNFSNINTEVGTKLTATSYTAADVLAKLLTVDGSGTGLDADTLDGLQSASANTVSTIVARDASGNFSAGTITAALTGTASIASSLNYTVAVAGGGTGATTTANARTNLGLVIGTDVQAYDADLAAIAGLTSAANALPYFTGVGTAAVTTLSAYGRTLIDDADASTARATLGLTIGSNVQAYDSNLAAIAGIATAGGIYTKTAAGAAVVRSLAQGTGITISNADGVAGNPTISVASYVSSVQGNTGAVIVSVPVTSVQGATGAVIVTNIGGNAATATNVAWTGVQSRPTALSQFSNDLGNYGTFISTASGGASESGNAGPRVSSVSLSKQGVNATLSVGVNCNCNCNC